MDLGLWGDERKWRNSDKIKVLTPVPEYDRHFVLCEHFGMEMVNIPMLQSGPDMQLAAELAAADKSVKGYGACRNTQTPRATPTAQKPLRLWLVPKLPRR